jgi:hypothetical protein
LFSLENGQERDQLECAIELQQEKIQRLQIRNKRLASSQRAIDAGETTGTTVTTLVQLMADTSLPLRRRISAAQLLLGFKSPPDVALHTKAFLSAVFSDPEMDIAHRLECAELLRKAEDVQLRPSVERPTVAVEYDDAETIAQRAVSIERTLMLRRSAMRSSWPGSGRQCARERDPELSDLRCLARLQVVQCLCGFLACPGQGLCDYCSFSEQLIIVLGENIDLTSIISSDHGALEGRPPYPGGQNLLAPTVALPPRAIIAHFWNSNVICLL